MDKETLKNIIQGLRRRQFACRASIDILRKQWNDDQKTLQELTPEAVRAGIVVNLEINEP